MPCASKSKKKTMKGYQGGSRGAAVVAPTRRGVVAAGARRSPSGAVTGGKAAVAPGGAVAGKRSVATPKGKASYAGMAGFKKGTKNAKRGKK